MPKRIVEVTNEHEQLSLHLPVPCAFEEHKEPVQLSFEFKYVVGPDYFISWDETDSSDSGLMLFSSIDIESASIEFISHQVTESLMESVAQALRIPRRFIDPSATDDEVNELPLENVDDEVETHLGAELLELSGE